MRNKFIIIVLSLFSLFSCHKTEQMDNNQESRELFLQSEMLIKTTIMEIYESKDSLEVDSLSNAFEKKITDINFVYAPGTDLKLTEEENDSLFKLLERMTHVKSKKLLDLSLSTQDTLLYNEEKMENNL